MIGCLTDRPLYFDLAGRFYADAFSRSSMLVKKCESNWIRSIERQSTSFDYVNTDSQFPPLRSHFDSLTTFESRSAQSRGPASTIGSECVDNSTVQEDKLKLIALTVRRLNEEGSVIERIQEAMRTIKK